MNVWKITRSMGVLLALLALLAFSTVVVSDFDCHNAADDARCPYCHLTHQAPVKPEITHSVSTLEPVAFLPLPEDTTPTVVAAYLPTSPRAPPAA